MIADKLCCQVQAPETELFQRLVGPGHYVDAGAHIGTHTLTFARLVGPDGVAAEASRSTPRVVASS